MSARKQYMRNQDESGCTFCVGRPGHPDNTMCGKWLRANYIRTSYIGHAAKLCSGCVDAGHMAAALAEAQTKPTPIVTRHLDSLGVDIVGTKGAVKWVCAFLVPLSVPDLPEGVTVFYSAGSGDFPLGWYWRRKTRGFDEVNVVHGPFNGRHGESDARTHATDALCDTHE